MSEREEVLVTPDTLDKVRDRLDVDYPLTRAQYKLAINVQRAYADESDRPMAETATEAWNDLLAHDAALRAENEELKVLAKRAFEEGWRQGYDCGMGCASYTGYCNAPTTDEAWEESGARQALDRRGEDG